VIPAAALSMQSNVERPAPTRNEVLARYRHLRGISKLLHAGTKQFIAPGAALKQARRLGLLDRKRLYLGSFDELCLATDLTIYTAPPGRSRAIDRFARNAAPPAGSDEALVLEAMCNARFAVLIMRRRHPAAGLILTDLFRDEDIWLVDEGLEMTLQDEGALHVTRYYTPGDFSMTAGVGMPVDIELLDDAIGSEAPQLTRKPKAEAINDPRLAEIIYRAAIREGIMENVAYIDPPAEGYAA
jgi:hypothetical protein